jgi:threonylcarbamoyladenosine tRNA methylthiotransferase MtaB
MIGEKSMLSGGCAEKLVAIKSVGCRTNQEEMASLRFLLENEGFQIIESVEDANFVIINTCAVTAGTETKTRRLLSTIASVSADAKILVTGCLAQQKPEELKAIPNVKWVVGNTYKNDILSIIQNDYGVFHSSFDTKKMELLPLVTVDVNALCNTGTKTRFPIKIQEGCDFYCSYCIVPTLRGPSRSAPENAIVNLFKKAIDAGYKEIVLTGTHIGQYGERLDDTIVNLLRTMLTYDGDFRIRLSSLDPRDLSDDLLDLIVCNDRLCDHLHISLQSLCGEVLEKMNRPYDNLEEIINRLISFRKRMPYAGIGADFIVGHPGETEENFSETIDNIQKIGFSYAHVFRYSLRPGTAAAFFPEQVSDTAKTRRSIVLKDVIEGCRIAFLEKNHGITRRIIVESENPVRGLTSNYLHVEIPDFKAVRNAWLYVSVSTNERGRYFLAEPVMCEVV